MTLDRTQLADIRKLLEGRRFELIEEIREEMANSENQQYVELIGRTAADSGDAAVGDMLADLNLDILDRHVQQLREIDAARVRLDEGSYGVCVECGENIAFARLLASPVALRCYDCQQKREKTHAHPAAPRL